MPRTHSAIAAGQPFGAACDRWRDVPEPGTPPGKQARHDRWSGPGWGPVRALHLGSTTNAAIESALVGRNLLEGLHHRVVRLLHRLFHAEGLVVDLPRALSYGCRCSRARLATVLQGFPESDLDEMAQDGAITMTCEFCNMGFRFDRGDVRGGAGRA